MKTCFSEGKLMKQFGIPFLSKRTPLSTNAPISEQFFHAPPFCPNFKNKNHHHPPMPPPPSTPNLRERGETSLYACRGNHH